MREEIVLAFIEEMAERGLTKSSIARALGVHRSAVSRILNGTAPLELRTIGQLSWVLGRDAEFKLNKKKRRPRLSNHIDIQPTNTASGFGPTLSAVATP